MIRYFAAHPTASNILMVIIILAGLTALPTLTKETFPEIKTSQIRVTVAYPGASPSEIEKAICKRLEDATDGISYLLEQKCEATDNVGTLTLEMQEAGDIKQFKDDVKSAVDLITDFPDKAEDPVIEELGRTKPVVSIAINAKLPPSELKALAEEYRLKLLAVAAIPMVKVEGFSDHELSVTIKSENLRLYQLSVQDIANLIRNQAIDLPAGILKSHKTYYQIKFKNERTTVNQLRDLVIINNDKGGRIRLGDIATVKDKFVDEERQIMLDGKPAALLLISKNRNDDTLTVFNAVKAFVKAENAKLPKSTKLVITQDTASIVQGRLDLLLKNGLQGLVLATLVLFLFFSWRYTFWIALGLPISFVGGLVVMSVFGISINMISMVALLMAIGILMDDAIVISESIETEYKKGKTTLIAAVDGIKKVGRGVFSSYMTSAILFGSLLFIKGEMGQVLGVLPVVLLAVLTISLVEAFLILPHHLKHSLSHKQESKIPQWRISFAELFEKSRAKVGKLADWSIRYRYAVVGGVLAILIACISLIPAGIVKFKSFPDIEGNVLEVRFIMPQGTPFSKTKSVVATLLDSLEKSKAKLPKETNGKLIKHVQVFYGKNEDAGETGPHLATITLDLLDAEKRVASLNDLRLQWLKATPAIAGIVSIQFKEPRLGPAGKAISIRLKGKNLDTLARASWDLKRWFEGYSGVSNVSTDLRPGKPQFTVKLQAGALKSGLNAQTVSAQLRAAYQGLKVSDVYKGRESYEINVKLDYNSKNALKVFETLPVFNTKGQSIPLSSIANIRESREYSRITRVNHQRTVTVSGDVDSKTANTNEVINDTRKKYFPVLQKKYPDLVIGLEGEVKNARTTNRSVLSGFILGIAGVFLLLSMQFRNYKEPIVVLLNIPLALIGVILGHWIMGLNLTMPSMIGFVSLAGIVVNDSILLVEFVKIRSREGMNLHAAAGKAVQDRFRAVFLTSITTIAGMLPLLSETSLQAQVLVPLVASVVFGMITSTLLIIMVLPASYSILEDIGFVEVGESSDGEK